MGVDEFFGRVDHVKYTTISVEDVILRHECPHGE